MPAVLVIVACAFVIGLQWRSFELATGGRFEPIVTVPVHAQVLWLTMMAYI